MPYNHAPGTCSRAHTRAHAGFTVSEFDFRQKRKPEQKASYFFLRQRASHCPGPRLRSARGCSRLCRRDPHGTCALRPRHYVGQRTLLWFRHGCSGHCMLLEHERYYGFDMDAQVIACSSFSGCRPLLSAVLPPLQPSWLASPAPWPTPQSLSPPSESTNLRALGRPLGHLMLSLMALIGDHIYQYFSMSFRGQPRAPMHEMLRTPVLWEPLEGNMPQSTASASKVESLKLHESARLQGSGGYYQGTW